MLSGLRNLANRYIIEYTVKTFGKSIEPRDFAFMAKTVKESSWGGAQADGTVKKTKTGWWAKNQEGTMKTFSDEDKARKFAKTGNPDNSPQKVEEGFSGWHGSARKSINELGDAKLIVRHKRSVDESQRGARSRQIESIFIENSAGERFKFPSNNLTAAKAMCRHVKEGGTPFDDFGQYIYETMEELNELKKFQRKNKRNDFFEDAQIGEEITSRITNLRINLKQIAGPKGYTHHFETFTRENTEVGKEKLDELKDNVTVKYFDESIAGSLPYVARVIENMRGRQAKEAEIIDFARYVMGTKDNIALSKPVDDADPENPASRKFRDPATAIAAWVTYLAPKVKDDMLANKMMAVSDLVHDVGSKHLNMAAAAINVIKQRGKVAEADELEDEKPLEEEELEKINEAFSKYSDVRKLFL
jgi:hypothetical protein